MHGKNGGSLELWKKSFVVRSTSIVYLYFRIPTDIRSYWYSHALAAQLSFENLKITFYRRKREQIYVEMDKNTRVQSMHVRTEIRTRSYILIEGSVIPLSFFFRMHTLTYTLSFSFSFGISFRSKDLKSLEFRRIRFST